MCVLTNKRYKTCRRGFLFWRLGHAPGVGLGVHKGLFFNMVMRHIKLTEMMSRTEYKSNYHPRVKLVTLGEVKRSNIITFQLQTSISKILYQTLYVYKRYETYRTKLSFCRPGHAPGAGLGGTGLKGLNVGICDGAPSTVRSSYFSLVSCFFFFLFAWGP